MYQVEYDFIYLFLFVEISVAKFYQNRQFAKINVKKTLRPFAKISATKNNAVLIDAFRVVEFLLI